ncbi:MAG: Histone acetyltransferase [Myxococcaceae bacterium]|nr:Histone acetyltransferase [Myxococcaceae bacterium]
MATELVLRVASERSDASPGRELVQAMLAELEVMYGPLDPAVTPRASAEDMAPPHGAFVVLYAPGPDGERAVACGGLKKLDATTGEIKRMYVVPEARGRGVARRLLGALEDAARAAGYERVKLDTGAKQPHAQALYASAGYASIADYNDNRYASCWFEKSLR